MRVSEECHCKCSMEETVYWLAKPCTFITEYETLQDGFKPSFELPLALKLTQVTSGRKRALGHLIAGIDRFCFVLFLFCMRLTGLGDEELEAPGDPLHPTSSRERLLEDLRCLQAAELWAVRSERQQAGGSRGVVLMGTLLPCPPAWDVPVFS